MHIVVCLKPVPNAQDIRINPETKTLDRSGASNVINPPDLNALEMALQLKDKHGAKVTVLSMCPPFGEPFLRECIAMGADDAILLSDRAFAGSDTYPTSYTLAAGIRAISALKQGEYKGAVPPPPTQPDGKPTPPSAPWIPGKDKPVFGPVDLVICGEETTDSSTGQTGPGIAEWNNWPQVTYIKDCTLVGPDGKPVSGKVEGEAKNFKVHCTQDLEGARSVWEADLPAVLSVNLGINTPRAPQLARKILAQKQFELTYWTKDALKDIDPTKLGLKGSPTVVGKIITIDVGDKKTEWIEEADPATAAKKLADALEARGLLKHLK
ncbi:MAG TPA: electron transfer flavoprotein subunit beta/FixA family protein [Candidatus Thermoplasmatota archaeon]|nr:electron transfer flavoprotein subunit beta/FixA family protein [Candidatus Thermoplasmatota archaeon]